MEFFELFIRRIVASAMEGTTKNEQEHLHSDLVGPLKYPQEDASEGPL